MKKGGYIFKDNWQLLSFQLSDNNIYNTIALPEHTCIHFPYDDEQSGYICAFPNNYEVQGAVGGAGDSTEHRQVFTKVEN